MQIDEPKGKEKGDDYEKKYGGYIRCKATNSGRDRLDVLSGWFNYRTKDGETGVFGAPKDNPAKELQLAYGDFKGIHLKRKIFCQKDIVDIYVKDRWGKERSANPEFLKEINNFIKKKDATRKDSESSSE